MNGNHADHEPHTRSNVFPPRSPRGDGRRIEREWTTLEAMIRLYCRDRHGASDELCDECAALAAFARLRLEKCPFGEAKPTCANCPIHCYRGRPKEREQIREIMAWAGPRMFLRHPVLVLCHLLDGRRGRRSGPRTSQVESPAQ